MGEKIKLETLKTTRQIVLLVNGNGVLKTSSEEWEYNATFRGVLLYYKV